MPSLITLYKNTTKMTPEGPNHVAIGGVPDRSGAQEEEEEKHRRKTHTASSNSLQQQQQRQPK
jgi:hypothetical protein